MNNDLIRLACERAVDRAQQERIAQWQKEVEALRKEVGG